MRELEPTLTDHAFAQRAIELWSRLDRTVGEVTRAIDDVRQSVVDVGALGSARGRELRLLEFHLAMPGFGLPPEATLALIERYTRVHRGWTLLEYLYDYHREPRPSGRKAHHWHDGVLHAHCEDPRHPRTIAHYRDVAVGLLEAAEEFRHVHLRGEVDCTGLFPLR